MGVIIFTIVLLLIGGVVFATLILLQKKKTREQYLEELIKFTEGKLEPIENGIYENSFRVLFEYEGERFIYEDIEKQGFRGKVYFAYLKIKASSDLTLTVRGKDRSLKVLSSIFLASEISTEKVGNAASLEVPSFLNDCNIYTNDVYQTNRFLADKKIAAIFKKFKNFDASGLPFLPIEIVEGLITLSFSSEPTFHPNLNQLMSDVGSISDHADTMLTLAYKLKTSV